jgi:hypothetical protein
MWGFLLPRKLRRPSVVPVQGETKSIKPRAAVREIKETEKNNGIKTDA